MTVFVDKKYDYSWADMMVRWLSRHWLMTLSIIMGIYVLVPFLAPVFMSMGLIVPGKVIYWVYSFLCHQLPERSYFLFGPEDSLTQFLKSNLSGKIRIMLPSSGNLWVIQKWAGRWLGPTEWFPCLPAFGYLEYFGDYSRKKSILYPGGVLSSSFSLWVLMV